MENSSEKTTYITPMLQDGPVLRIKEKKLPQLFVTLSICILGMCMGSAMTWPASSLTELQNPDSNSTLVLNEVEGSWVVSFLAIGAIPGAFITGFMAERFGRRITALLLGIPLLISWFIISLAKTAWLLYIARFLGGLPVGGIAVIIPMYISEIAGRERRATLGALFPLAISLGMLVQLSLSALMNYRYLSICLAGMVVLFLTSFYFAPESPVYHITKGRMASAKRSLVFFHGETKAERVLEETVKMIAATSCAERMTLGQLICDRAFVRGLIASLGISAELQLCGIGVVSSYSEKIFQVTGSSVDPKLSANIIFGFQVLAGSMQLFIVDRLPRKALLMQNCIIAFATLGALGLQTLYQWQIGWLPLFALVLHTIGFMWGFGPLVYIVMAELFASSAKEIAFALNVVLLWSLNFVMTKTFPLLVLSIGVGWTFMMYAGFMVLASFHIMFLVPETRGKTLVEIQNELYGKDNQ